MKNLISELLIFAILLSFIAFLPNKIPVAASTTASDITSSCTFTQNGNEKDFSLIRNSSLSDFMTFEKNSELTITSKEKIGALYVQFYNTPSRWAITSGNKTLECGTNGFLHEYIDVSSFDSNSVMLDFLNAEDIAQIYVFSDGIVPEWVQIWNNPCEKADLLMVVAHADDEHLFFGGVLPYYSALGYSIQVAYITDHVNQKIRDHERLDSLWTAGIRNYPVVGNFPDILALNNIDNAYALYQNSNVTRDDFIDFEVSLLRRFKPLVVMTHDFNGEYGHGTHMICADAMTKAIPAAANSLEYEASMKEYGLWSTPKVYFHSYGENKITLTFADQPMDQLGGKTPFYVSQQAFLCNKSQFNDSFYISWMFGTAENPVTLASSIEKYNPIEFGLYSSTVGADTAGNNDLFEHIVTYEKQDEILSQNEEQLSALESIKSENSKLDQQKAEMESLLSDIDHKKTEIQELDSGYQQMIGENNSKITEIRNLTVGMYIACTVLLCLAIFVILVLVAIMQTRKYPTKKKKSGNKDDNLQKLPH